MAINNTPAHLQTKEGRCLENSRKRFCLVQHYPLVRSDTSMQALAYLAGWALACSRLRDSAEKSFSKKKCKKRAGAGERQGGSPIFLATTAPFPKSHASYFRFARFNTSALCYLRAWHRLVGLPQQDCQITEKGFHKFKQV